MQPLNVSVYYCFGVRAHEEITDSNHSYFYLTCYEYKGGVLYCNDPELITGLPSLTLSLDLMN